MVVLKDDRIVKKREQKINKREENKCKSDMNRRRGEKVERELLLILAHEFFPSPSRNDPCIKSIPFSHHFLFHLLSIDFYHLSAPLLLSSPLLSTFLSTTLSIVSWCMAPHKESLQFLSLTIYHPFTHTHSLSLTYSISLTVSLTLFHQLTYNCITIADSPWAPIDSQMLSACDDSRS